MNKFLQRFQHVDLPVPQILKETDKEVRLSPREPVSASIFQHVDEVRCVPVPHVIEQVVDVPVPQVDEQQISTQDQHLQRTVEQEIDEPLLKMQRILRVGDVVDVKQEKRPKGVFRIGHGYLGR